MKYLNPILEIKQLKNITNMERSNTDSLSDCLKGSSWKGRGLLIFQGEFLLEPGKIVWTAWYHSDSSATAD